MTVTRRFSRRRLRLLLGRLRPPRIAWRALAILPLVLLMALLGAQGSAAWFTSAEPLPSPFHSGNWVSLMNPDTPSALSFTGFSWVGGRFRISGLVWDDYTGSFSVTSTAGVPMPLRLRLSDASGPTLRLGSTVVTEETEITIEPGEDGTLTFTLSGPYADWTGELEVSIGTNRYDWITVPLTVEDEPREITTVIDVDAPISVFCSGTAAPKFESLQLMTIKKAPGMQSIPLTMTMSQYNPTPLDGPGPHDAQFVQLLQPTPTTVGSATIGNPASAGTPTVAALNTSTAAQAILVSQGDTDKDNPTTLTITLSSPSDDVTGSVSYDFLLAHPNSHDCPKHGAGSAEAPNLIDGTDSDQTEQDSTEQTDSDQTEQDSTEQTDSDQTEQGSSEPPESEQTGSNSLVQEEE